MGTMMTKLTPARIAQIKASAKGQLPSFLSGGTYNDGNVSSVGGRVGNVGAAIGYDKAKKRPFGSVNIKGKVVGKFGPQG